MKKILVISNNNDDLNTISTFLEDLIPDCLVIPAQSGIVGIENTKAESPEMVFLDIEIGGIDRYEVCRTLKSNENTKHIPILLMTDIQSDPKSYVKGLETGATGFLGKPIDKAELAVQVDTILRIRALEKEKAYLKKQLQQAQKMESIGTLAGGIAHEFNNILFPIIGYTEMSMYDVSENSKTRKNLVSVLKAADRAKDLIQQIQNFSTKGEQERKPLKIQYIIKETLKLLRASLPATIAVRFEIDNTCGPVVGDPSEIQQMLMNLCSNAYQVMEEKGGELEVTLQEVDLAPSDLSFEIDLNPGRYLKLTVKDTGPGFEQTEVKNIFDPQYRTNDWNESAGMGLNIVHDIVRSYKGMICISSDPDQGTTIDVYLPLMDTQTNNISEISTETHMPHGTETILLVDDEEDVLEMMHSMLERLGYQVISRLNGVKALEIFQKASETFDLVITDQTMPKMTGMELIGELRLIRPDIPIILCTGFNEKITEDNTRHLEIGALIGKPVRIAEIAEIIREVLDRKL
ncbi:MAG TPA: hybrid sensor histidine kinase/response regulator [Desulfobacteraceae bacterium]|nr:hybrid sensor histidine kinase/response regulator [Desulfobacteraceae bacterium]